jgi:hypothetical protein
MTWNSIVLRLFAFTAGFALNPIQLPAAENTSSAATNSVAKRIEITGVHNAFRVTERI